MIMWLHDAVLILGEFEIPLVLYRIHQYHESK